MALQRKQAPEIGDWPRVSVITPFLDNDAFLAETIESVVAQSYDNWEYLLIDDGSGPAATAIAKRYADRYPGKIRYFEHPGHLNRGISATRNVGVRHAHGEFIAFLDSDDIWAPSKLADHVALLDAHQQVGMVCGSTVEWRSWSNGSDRILPTGRRRDTVIYPPEAAFELYPIGKSRAPSFSDVVFRAELVRRLGGFEEQFTGIYDDQVLLLKVYLSTPVYFSSMISNWYRQHPTSTSATSIKAGTFQQGALFFFEWLESYLKTTDKVEPRLALALRRKLLSYRHPRMHRLLSTVRDRGAAIRGSLKIRTRIQSGARRVRRPKPRPLILVYHRIADIPVDPWGLAVSPAFFEEQLGVLRRTRRPLALMDFADGLRDGTLSPDAVAVTFDDGYVDNLVAGKPRLAAADVPATVFLATGYINTSREFWWDELTRLLLLGRGPEVVELMVRGQSLRVSLEDGPLVRRGSDASTDAPKRHSALMTIWRVLRFLEDGERERLMQTLRSAFTVTDVDAIKSRAMTSEETMALVDGGLITVGAHTVTHPVLSALEVDACRREITESKLTCEEIIGAPVSTFAYPYGDFNAKAREEVMRANFSVACSTQSGPAVATSDRFALPRVYATNVDGESFERALLLLEG